MEGCVSAGATFIRLVQSVIQLKPNFSRSPVTKRDRLNLQAEESCGLPQRFPAKRLRSSINPYPESKNSWNPSRGDSRDQKASQDGKSASAKVKLDTQPHAEPPGVDSWPQSGGNPRRGSPLRTGGNGAVFTVKDGGHGSAWGSGICKPACATRVTKNTSYPNVIISYGLKSRLRGNGLARGSGPHRGAKLEQMEEAFSEKPSNRTGLGFRTETQGV